MKKKIKFVDFAILMGIILLIILLVTSVSAASGAIFMALWNVTVVPLFNAPQLSFWVAWPLWVLICLVAGAFRSVYNSSK